MTNSIKKFINYWIFRYLLVTELYMVEKWERLMIHIVFFIIFSLISLFNTRIVVAIISWATSPIFTHHFQVNQTSPAFPDVGTVEL